MASLDNRIGIITGASAGIGEALTHDLARSGARLVINARREAKLREIASQYPEGQISVLAGDAGDPARPAGGAGANLYVSLSLLGCATVRARPSALNAHPPHTAPK